MTESESISFTSEGQVFACRLDRVEQRELMAA
jgi:hypothetical protein